MDMLIYFAFVLMLIGSFFIGLIIGKKAKHFDGLFIVDESDFEKTNWTLDVKMDPREIPNKKELVFKVAKMHIQQMTGDV